MKTAIVNAALLSFLCAFNLILQPSAATESESSQLSAFVSAFHRFVATSRTISRLYRKLQSRKEAIIASREIVLRVSSEVDSPHPLGVAIAASHAFATGFHVLSNPVHHTTINAGWVGRFLIARGVLNEDSPSHCAEHLFKAMVEAEPAFRDSGSGVRHLLETIIAGSIKVFESHGVWDSDAPAELVFYFLEELDKVGSRSAIGK